jgi:colanic acid/amylovoran biosynthesis glycosyltransferase
MARPSVSVVVPFHGPRAEAAEALAGFEQMALGDGDEILLVDNTPEGVAAGLGGNRVRVVAAPAQQSSYHARNVGARNSSGEWILFIDADCRPEPHLADAFFARPVERGVGAVAGEVVGAAGQEGRLARYARSRRVLDQRPHLQHDFLPFANTSCLLVRRVAWEAIGGFEEGIRSGGDADFCWRIQLAGWGLELRPEAVVEHLHREKVRGLARQMLRYGAGTSWLHRRYDRRFRRYGMSWPVARALVGAAGLTVLGKGERAWFRLLDAVHFGALGAGWYLSNDASMRPDRAPPVPGALDLALVVDRFPELSETFIAEEARALQTLGHRVRVESRIRAELPNHAGAAGLVVGWQEDDGRLRRCRDLPLLAVRSPLRCLADLVERRKFAAEERWVPPLRTLAPAARRLQRSGVRHIHAHFAADAAFDALRLARVLGITWSLTCHAYDIYSEPRNLRRKLAAASFVTSGCQYTVRDLARLMPPRRVEDLHEVIMGVDPERFERRRPYPGGRTVIAVGRLVEKKGFAHLIDALGLLEGSGACERLLLVGDGPLEQQLRARAEQAGVAHRVSFEGARSPAKVRDLLEEADLLVMPCVIAADGNRDSMPVVVKEAMAMEVPVIASDEVGLPELVREPWGKLVPPGRPESLAEAIRELVELPPARRAEMGRAGRDFVREFANVRVETQKLAGLIADVVARGPGPRG